jgi:hypothetical protein
MVGVATIDQLLLAAAMSLISAILAWRLHKICSAENVFEAKTLPDDV